MVFYNKGLRVRKTPLPFVSCARKAAILHVQIWSAHESDVVGLIGWRFGFAKVTAQVSAFAEDFCKQIRAHFSIFACLSQKVRHLRLGVLCLHRFSAPLFSKTPRRD